MFVPDRIKVKHTYTDIATISTNAATGFATYIYNGNSVYDPSYSEGGSEAFYFTQLSQLYYNYRVNASAISVGFLTSFIAQENNVMFPFTAWVRPASSGNVWVATAPEHSMKDGYCKSRMLSWLAAGKWQYIKHYATTRKVDEQSAMQYYPDDGYFGSATSDPEHRWVWQLGVQKFADVVDEAHTFFVKVTLTYYTVWANRRQFRTGLDYTWKTSNDVGRQPTEDIQNPSE